MAFLQVPAQGSLKAAVRTDEAQQAVTRNTEEVSIPPKPVIMHQDVSIFYVSVRAEMPPRSRLTGLPHGCPTRSSGPVLCVIIVLMAAASALSQMEGFSEVVAFDEVIDNSIRANATCITAKLLDSGGGLVTGLVCSDDGVSSHALECFSAVLAAAAVHSCLLKPWDSCRMLCCTAWLASTLTPCCGPGCLLQDGMPHDSAVNHMRLAHTDSGAVVAPRGETDLRPARLLHLQPATSCPLNQGRKATSWVTQLTTTCSQTWHAFSRRPIDRLSCVYAAYNKPLAAAYYFSKNLSRHGGSKH